MVLEFEVASNRVERTERDGPVSMVVVDPNDKYMSLDADIESQGIMFLTTNRVSSFDSAFQSRIHMALKVSRCQQPQYVENGPNKCV